MHFYCFDSQIRPGPGGEGVQILFKPPYRSAHMGGFRGETGKSQVIWVSIENKQSDMTPPLNEVGPPPPPRKMLDLLWNLGKG